MEAKIIPLTPEDLAVHGISTEARAVLLLFAATVRAGFPSPAADYSAEPIDLNSYITQNPTSTFLVKVEGDSMIGAHIEPGDLAVDNQSVKAENGKIVLAFVEGEFTIKRLRMENDATYLEPENPDYSTIKVASSEAGRIWGVVVGVVKKL